MGQADSESTSGHRIAAFRRLGHEVEVYDPEERIPRFFPFCSLNVRTGFRLVSGWVGAHLQRKLHAGKWDLAWIDSGPVLGPAFYRWLRSRGAPVVNYNLDNPFVPRDFRKWDQYKKSLALQDMTLLPRQESVLLAKHHGAPDAVLVARSYDPVAHHPSRVENVGLDGSGVVFVGSWMKERGPFMLELLARGVPLQIYGNHWQKDRAWGSLAPAWKGPAVYGSDYVRTIRQARVALGLVSLENRDEDTTRSVEIPFIGGGVFCASRTKIHEQLYREGQEAFFWQDAAECAALCRKLLSEPEACRRVASQARARVIQLGLSNDEVLQGVLIKIKKKSSG